MCYLLYYWLLNVLSVILSVVKCVICYIMFG